jgi:OmcA/MtrC family decaheme c-type cytochrome
MFWLSNKYGLLDPDEVGRLLFSISGPNEDYDFYVQEDAVGMLDAVGDGRWSYQFDAQIPGNASGSYSVGVEGRINGVVINPGTNKEFTINDQIQNFTNAFAVTDDEPVARRMVVDGDKCNACHSNLSLHGGNRHNPQYCVTCHQPEANDEEVRPDDAWPPESIHFKYLIHKIHRGAELENGYVVYGFQGSVHDFGHIEFPGDLRNCETCHVNGSHQLPLPDGLLDTPTPYGFLEVMEPETSACLSCHDSFNAAAHAAANTGALGESCNTCHGEDKPFSVDYVHAR